MDVPEFTLKEVHLVLEGFRATYGKQHGITTTAPHTQDRCEQIQANGTLLLSDWEPTNVLVQEADESGGHDVPVLAAELHWRLYPIIHH